MAVTYTFTNGETADADEVNQNFTDVEGGYGTIAGLNVIRGLIDRAGVWSAGMIDWWGDAYIDADGRENSVIIASTGATFDTNKYKVTIAPTVYVEITATSLTPSNFAINNCLLIPNITNGKWLLYCTTGTNEVKISQIYKTLFYGTDGTDPRASATYITGLTALKTSITNDIGKRAHYAKWSAANPPGVSIANYVGTFANNSTNNNCRLYSNLRFSNLSRTATISFPSGTTVNSVSNGTSAEIGTDTSSENKNNPTSVIANFDLSGGAGASNGDYATCLTICVGGITWNNTSNFGTFTSKDFFTVNSVPDFTDGTSISMAEYVRGIFHNIPTGTFPATISKAIGVPLIADWETGADIQYKLTNTGGDDSGWLDAMDSSPEISSFTAFSNGEPDTLIVKLIPKDTDPTAGYPSIKGFSVRAT